MFAFLISAIIGRINFTQTSTEASASSNGFFQLEFTKDGLVKNPISETPSQYEYAEGVTADAYRYKAAKVDYVKFYFDFSDWTFADPTIDTKGTASTADDTYNLRVEVEYLKGYKNDGETFFADQTGLHAEVIVNNTLQKQCPISKNWKNEFSSSLEPLTWKIHDNNVGTSSTGQKTFTGWGIYRFKFVLGDNIQRYSDFFILEPTMEVNSLPVVTVNNEAIEEVVYQVSPTGEYKHIDPNQIVWYVYGKAEDGDNYALLKSDLDTTKFQMLECTEYLHLELPRTGYTFTLPRPVIKGEWKVWCEYTPYGQNITTKSEDFYLIIKNDALVLPYHWIIIGICAFGICITLIVIAVKIKHEKIF